MPGFTLNAGQLALSAEELSSVAAGLRSMESVGITVRGGAFTENGREDSAIRIDLGSFYHGSLKEKIGLLRRAVAVRRCEKFRLVEEYGPQNFTVREDGRLYTEWGFSSCEQALRWFLPFGDCVQIIGPQYFREQYVQAVRRMLEPYSEKTGLTEGRREER